MVHIKTHRVPHDAGHNHFFPVGWDRRQRPLVSIKLGEGNRDEAEQIMGNAVVLLLIISTMITVFGLVFLEPAWG